jgi:hypothetical protein
MNLEPIHILMRFSDKLGAIEDTIEVHNKIIEKRGSVWFGKMGKTLGVPHVERINKQREEGISTHLYLVQKSPKVYEVYRGIVITARRTCPIKEKNLIPDYYEQNHILKYMRLWIKLSKLEQMEPVILRNLRIANSGLPASETLRTSMAAMFIVKEQPILSTPALR